MPCAEIADAIVETGRETLSRAIHQVESTKKWNAKVVYGDTDSMFVLLEGRTKEEAFAIGREIEAEVTKNNPKPVKLKFEKVYTSCVLQAKKRYSGQKWESEQTTVPEMETKGLEIVRRNSPPVVQRIMTKTLSLLFAKADLSIVKRYVCKELEKVLANEVPLSDMVVSQAVRDPDKETPACSVARKAAQADPRRAPNYMEKFQYVVISGTKKHKLRDLVVSPLEFLRTPGLVISSAYYINKQILPALARVLELAVDSRGQQVDVASWVQSITHRTQAPPPAQMPAALAMGSGGGGGGDRGGLGKRQAKQSSMHVFLQNTRCVLCGEELVVGGAAAMWAGGVAGGRERGTEADLARSFCEECRLDRAQLTLVVHRRLGEAQRSADILTTRCLRCTGQGGRLLTASSVSPAVLSATADQTLAQKGLGNRRRGRGAEASRQSDVKPDVECESTCCPHFLERLSALQRLQRTWLDARRLATLIW
jgi:DNA polymerase zeta